MYFEDYNIIFVVPIFEGDNIRGTDGCGRCLISPSCQFTGAAVCGCPHRPTHDEGVAVCPMKQAIFTDCSSATASTARSCLTHYCRFLELLQIPITNGRPVYQISVSIHFAHRKQVTTSRTWHQPKCFTPMQLRSTLQIPIISANPLFADENTKHPELGTVAGDSLTLLIGWR